MSTGVAADNPSPRVLTVYVPYKLRRLHGPYGNQKFYEFSI